MSGKPLTLRQLREYEHEMREAFTAISKDKGLFELFSTFIKTKGDPYVDERICYATMKWLWKQDKGIMLPEAKESLALVLLKKVRLEMMCIATKESMDEDTKTKRT